MAHIYCITNIINNKRYVGKTTLSVEERFKKHCSDSQKDRYEKRPLYDAFAKYGIENFIIEELEYVEDESILSEREIHWINELHTYGKNGYNATKGGDGKILYDYNEFIELYNLGYNSIQIKEKTGATVPTINKVLKAHGLKIRPGYAKKIDQYDLAGNYIQCFYGSLEAADWCVEKGLSKSKHSASNHILDCCKNKSQSSFGYKWVYGSVPK